MTLHDLENDDDFTNYDISGFACCSNTWSVGIIANPSHLGG
jgi:hypothetical protein